MNLLAIVGSPRKGKATDILVGKAVEGVKSKSTDSHVIKLHLIDHNIQFCKNCLTCRDNKTKNPVAECSIRYSMDDIREDVLQSDVLIFGTPVHMGDATAIMMTFLERICWTFGKPERQVPTIKGCPLPRSEKKRKAVIIITSGIVPPMYRRFCDWATGQIKGVVADSLDGKIVGDRYAGAIENRGMAYYLQRAFNLGKKLV